MQKKHQDLQHLIREGKLKINFLLDIFLLKNGKALNISKSKSKHFHSCFIMLKVEPPTCINRWLYLFGVSNDSILNSINLCTKSSTAISFPNQNCT